MFFFFLLFSLIHVTQVFYFNINIIVTKCYQKSMLGSQDSINDPPKKGRSSHSAAGIHMITK